MNYAYQEFLEQKNEPVTNAEKINFIVEYNLDRMTQGVLKPNDALDSHRKVAAALNIRRALVVRAYNILIELGYLVSEPRQAIRVNPSLPDMEHSGMIAFKKELSVPMPEEPSFGKYMNDMLKYITIGNEDINPAVFMLGKPNRVVNTLTENTSRRVKDWEILRNLDDRFLSIAQLSRARTRKFKMCPEQMTVGYYRPMMIEVLFPLLVERGDGVILSSHTAAWIIRELEKRTQNLFLIDTDKNGLPLEAIRKLILQQRNTDVPISVIFSNPIWDTFFNAKDIHKRRTALVELANELGVLLLEEYEHDEWVENTHSALVERVGAPLGNLVTFGRLSLLESEMRKLVVVMAPDKVVALVRKTLEAIPYEDGVSLTLLEQLNKNGTYAIIVEDGKAMIQESRDAIRDLAHKYLDKWFDVIPANCDSSLWLMTRKGEGVDLSDFDFNEMGIQYDLGVCLSSGLKKVKAMRVSFGSGKNTVFEDVFKKLQDCLSMN